MAYEEGPYAGVLPGPPPGDIPGYDDYDDHRGGAREYDDWNDSDIKPKKGNKKSQKDSKDDSKGPVVVKYEGLLLERAEAKDGEKRSWGRVIKCKMHFPDEDLIRLVKLHRKQSTKSTMQIFRELESKQQHVVSHAIEERKATETNKNAEWHLVDIQRIPPKRSRGWGSSKQEIEKLQVILKRQPKTPSKETESLTKTSKSTKTTKDNISSSRDENNIIDISQPVNKKSNTTKGNSNGNKKPKKARSMESLIDNYEDPIGGLGIRREHFNNQGRNSQQLPPDPFPPALNNIPPPPPGLGGPGPLPPFNQNGGDFMGPPPPPPVPQPPHHGGGGGGMHFNNPNPFQPDPHIATVGQYDSSPTMHDHDFPQFGARRPSARSLSRPAPPRRSSTSMAHPGVDAWEFNQMRNELEDLKQDLREAVNERRDGSDSSEWTRDEEIFDPPMHHGRGLSPISSPDTHYSDVFPPQRHKSVGREPRRGSIYRRSSKFEDVEYEPEYSHGPRRDRRYSQAGRHSSRPRLIHAATYDNVPRDDYPRGASSFTSPTFAPQRPQRRLTEYAEYDHDRYDYERRPRSDYRDIRDPYDRRSTMYEPEYERNDRQRREYGRDRRRSVVDGGRYYP